MLICVENVLDADELKHCQQVLSTAQWQDGAATAGSIARHQKRNQQLAETSETATTLGHLILRKLGQHPTFISAALPNKIYPPKFNRYADGGTYGTHVDSAVMRPAGTNVTLRSDLSATLFLSDPDSYEGGELEIDGAFGVQSVKLAAGDMVLYPSASLHRVTPVTSGARIASFFWVESLVHDDAARTALFDLDQAIQGLTATVSANDPHLLRLTSVYHNMLRLWATP